MPWKPDEKQCRKKDELGDVYRRHDHAVYSDVYA